MTGVILVIKCTYTGIRTTENYLHLSIQLQKFDPICIQF